MRLDEYLAETSHIAREQGAMLDEARTAILAEHELSRLEKNGILHALQVLVENAIGRVKQILKHAGEPVPVSAYDAFAAWARLKKQNDSVLEAWNGYIGLRNRIVHDYMNLDLNRILELVRTGGYQPLVDFLCSPLS